MTLRECYDQMNGSYDDAKARLMMDSMMERFLQKFLEDKTMEDLRRAVASGDIPGSFRGAHTLKGVAANLETYCGDCYLGIDAGSTTTKLALIGQEGQLLYSFYANNKGNPIETAKSAIWNLKTMLPGSARIARTCSTGYGEALLKSMKQFNVIAATFYEHYGEILNFYNNRSTNAAAESFNAKIKLFRANLHGVTDKKFFLFRIAKLYGYPH